MARVIAMGTPLADEELILRRVKLAFAKAFGGNDAEIDKMAERHALYLREAEMHAVVTFRPETTMAGGLIKNAFIVGLEQLSQLRGCIVVSAHFSHCYALAMRLGYAAHMGELDKVAVLVRSPAQGRSFDSAWFSAYAAADLFCERCVTMVDTRLIGTGSALASLQDLLAGGATLLLYADGTVLPPGTRGVTIAVGNLTITIPYGGAKLAEVSGRPMVAARVLEQDDRFGMAFSPPVSAAGQGAGPIFASEVQRIFDEAMEGDVVRWQQWTYAGAQLEVERSGSEVD